MEDVKRRKFTQSSEVLFKVTKPNDFLDHDFSESIIEHKNKTDHPNYREDLGNIVLLFFLYLLQGVPMGLAGSVPMILQNKGATYAEQGQFSLHYWPFSIKLLWAPIVDSYFSDKFGRRKSWLIPSQYLLGLSMILTSYKVDQWLGNTGQPLDINMLLLTFFSMYFLAATQDIAVDGWALTMLKRKNVGYASTCNSVGQTTGYFLGYVLFMALESAEFCNSYLRMTPQPEGIVTLSEFIFFWGVIFLLTTTLVLLLKSENQEETDEPQLGILETYKLLWKICKLPNMIQLIIALLTSKIAFAAVDSVTGLKLVEGGVPKERMALLSLPLMPFQILLPLLISRYTAGPRPLSIYLKAYPIRLALGPLFAVLVYMLPSWKDAEGHVPWHFYFCIAALFIIHQGPCYAIYVAQMSFFNKISDPVVGGTYLTLLNTLSNLGSNWPLTLMLWSVDPMTWKNCSNGGNPCNTHDEVEACRLIGGSCHVTIDGYYLGVAVTTIIGLIWIKIFRNRILRLEQLSSNSWKCS